jgi:hypothetical protein
MNGDTECILNKLDEPREGLLKQELISWEVKDGMLYKKKLIRKYGEPSSGDYIDSWHSEPLVRVKT